MNRFTAKYADQLVGTLSGFDRLVFRGHLRRLSFVEGLSSYLQTRHVLLKDFSEHVQTISEQIKKACTAPLKAEGVPLEYLPSATTSKEAVARKYAAERGITSGPICLLSALEVCPGFDIYRNREQQRLEVVSRLRKCLHLYRYEIHPVFGFMHTRIQTWFPFRVQVCLNGREWLARQLEREGLDYQRQDNCFLEVSDFTRAQALLDEQLTVNWPQLLGTLATTINPLHQHLFGDFCPEYYWSAHQSEWATDLVFRDPDGPQGLRRLYPLLLRHGMTTLASPDVLRFLGRKFRTEGRVAGNFLGEVTSDVKTRQEGVRLKHRVNGNAVKIYDKAYTQDRAVLRVETTVNEVTDFKVFRPKTGEPEGDREWRPMRKSVADVYRRAQVSQAANERYLDALASAEDGATLAERLQTLTQPAQWKGKRVRALQPFSPGDTALFAAVSRGEFALNGFRNRDLRRLLLGDEATMTPVEIRRRSGKVTRMLRMLRAHGLIQKVSGTHRYQVTAHGRESMTALLTARDTPVAQLLRQAA